MTHTAAYTLGAVSGVLLVAVALLLHDQYASKKVHVLEAPMLLTANGMGKQMHLLPKGTTLYFDEGFSEGFERYKVYVNIDRTPLVLKELDDPTMIDPLTASVMDADELKRASRTAPLAKQDLQAILASGGMQRDEIKALLEDFLSERK
ncbi:hypothetical protein [Massilia sp. CCM 8734]|uniref:hypothetical protein n=1 Tax=Massilia sp. CCM 8734 TaxID=2609283 RepID=UPI00142138BE|nr:hypothetical protein [Massilia sp. CCM 8734]NHZ99015.1 hypothetical protein [Massilia sp. CCM 8734]